MDQKDELIRARAYDIWQAEGSPKGRDEEHWHRAAREIDEASAAPSDRLVPAEPLKNAAAGPKRKSENSQVEPAALSPNPAGDAVSPKRRKAAASAGEALSSPASAKPVKRGRGAKA